MAARFESKITPNVYLGTIPVGGLTPAEAGAKLEAWWESEKVREIRFSADSVIGKVTLKLDNTGIGVDKARSLANLPLSGFMDSAKQAMGAEESARHYPIVFISGAIPTKLNLLVQKHGPQSTGAHVFYAEDRIVRQPASTGLAIDPLALQQQLQDAVTSGDNNVVIPLTSQPTGPTKASLDQIQDVVSAFTTRFPVSKRDRNTNIRIASSKINGFVMMPGDTFSFNTVVGKRTIEDGFKTAPVFKNGKHDMGVGGGICQVSSTLYNAALFANLQIVERHNHSMPVAYLPVGRDATVDYGSLDLAFKNNLTTPIALSSDYEAGKLTFRILGTKNPALSVSIDSSDASTWDVGTQRVFDRNMPAGKTKVIDKGSRGHSIKTYRVVCMNGVQVAREALGRSFYKGSVRQIAVGTMPATSAPSPAPVATPADPPVPAIPASNPAR
jgi:vancomycin resistance protein YoaR